MDDDFDRAEERAMDDYLTEQEQLRRTPRIREGRLGFYAVCGEHDVAVAVGFDRPAAERALAEHVADEHEEGS